MKLSVILPTRNPHPDRWRETLAGLAMQSLPWDHWELLVVDNGSETPVALPAGISLPPARVIREDTAGLTPARRRGFLEARGELVVLVDDDNVLSVNYLASAVAAFERDAKLGVAGGPVHPAWEITPPMWITEFHSLLALHDHGPDPLVQSGGPKTLWPRFAPVGAGMCLRRTALEPYLRLLEASPERTGLDRRAGSLASGGDNDIVFTALHAGWDVAYRPELIVRHLIPPERTEVGYLGRLNESIQRSWVRVLALHDQCPWPPIAPWTLPLRTGRAWWRHRSWRSPARYVRWCGARGHFLGRADLFRR